MTRQPLHPFCNAAGIVRRVLSELELANLPESTIDHVRRELIRGHRQQCVCCKCAVRAGRKL